MAVIQPFFGTRQSFSGLTGLNGLATGSTAVLGVIDNTTALADGFRIDTNITLPSTGVVSTGTLVFSLIQSSDGGTAYTDAVTPPAVGVTLKNALPIAVLAANAASQVVVQSFDLPLPVAPLKWTLAVTNNTGTALAGSGNLVSYTPITFTVA